MVRQDNNKDIIADKAVAYINAELHNAVHDFKEELDVHGKYTTAYKDGRDGSAKTHVDNAIKMIRWIYETEFGLTPPNPFTNVEVDGINIDIRTFEDGL